MKIKGFLNKLFGAGGGITPDLAQVTSWQAGQVVAVSDMFNFEQEVYDKIKCLSDPYMNTSDGGIIVSGITPLSPVANNNVSWSSGYVRFPDQVQGQPPAGNVPAAAIPTNALVAYIGAGATATGWTNAPYLVVRFTGFVPNSATPTSVTNYAIGYSVLFTATVNTATDVLIAYCSSSLPSPNISTDNCAYNLGYSIFTDRSFMGVWNATTTPPVMNPVIGQTWIVQGSSTISYINYKGTVVNVPVTNGQLLWYGYSTTSGTNQWMTLPVSLFPSIVDNGSTVTINKPVTVNGTFTCGQFSSASIIDNGVNISTKSPMQVGGAFAAVSGSFNNGVTTSTNTYPATGRPVINNSQGATLADLAATTLATNYIYQKLPSGLIIQTGVINWTGGDVTITLLNSFPNAFVSVQVTFTQTNHKPESNNTALIVSGSKNQFTLGVGQTINPETFYYVAYGY